MTFTLQVALGPENKGDPGMSGQFGVVQGQRRKGPSIVIVMIQNPAIEPY